MALSDTRIRNAKPQKQPYKLSDGDGMFLLVTPSGSRYWRLDYRISGKRKTLALGVYPTVSLSAARAARSDAKTSLANGDDPSEKKKFERQAAQLAGQNTFKAVALEWLENQSSRFVPAYRLRILSRLEADIFPRLGERRIADVLPLELLGVLRVVEQRGAVETARRLRQLCGQVFRYAIVTGRATQDPSADLRGALKSPGRQQGRKAIPLDQVGAFLNALRTYDGELQTARALRLMVLTFTRTNELRAAQWTEFEGLEGSTPLWRIPAERMKMGREHIVPLARQAVSCLLELKSLPSAKHSPFLFPSAAREGYMSNNTMLYAMYRLGYHGRATVHGFRALASTSLNEMGFNADVIERQLAHQQQSAVRAAYNRAEYLAERRIMMQHWADHVTELALTESHRVESG